MSNLTVKCPNCNQRTVVFRFDAYANYELTTKGKFVYSDTDTMDELQSVECTNCEKELTKEEVYLYNGIKE